jgi:hypothetical protein
MTAAIFAEQRPSPEARKRQFMGMARLIVAANLLAVRLIHGGLSGSGGGKHAFAALLISGIAF